MVLGGKSVRAAIKFSVRQIANTRRKPRPHDWRRALLEFMLKVRQQRVPLMVSAGFVLFGFLYYASVEPDTSFRHLLMVSLSVRNPYTTSDVSGLYQLSLPIFLEVIFFGFVLTALVDRYDPIAMGRILASQLYDHTVVIGYTHLGERIVNHLIQQNLHYCVIESDHNSVAELLVVNEPVVVGDPTDLITLDFANIKTCREVFLLVDNLQQAFVISFHVRSISPTCKLYIEISNHEEFREYFTGDPFKAYTFSVSRFAVDSLREWTSNLSPITSNPNTPTVTPKAGPQVNPPDTSAMPPLSLNKPAASAAVPHPSRGDVDASAATAPGDTIELPLRQQSPLNNTSVHPAVSPMPKRTPSRTDPPITTSLIIGSDVCAREFVKFLVRERPFWNTIVVDEGLSEYFLADAVDSEVQELLPQMQSSTDSSSSLLDALPKDIAPYVLMGRRRSYTRVFPSPVQPSRATRSQSTSASADRDADNKKNRMDVMPNLTLINCFTKRLRYMAEHIDFSLINYLFITWPEENRVSDAIYLAMAMQRQHPHIKLFVRTFDDQLREVLESFGAKVFSTSSYAFNMLQREVSKDSNLSHATSVQ